VSDTIQSLHDLLVSTMSGIGATVESGPKKNESNGVQEWTIAGPQGGQVVFGVTDLAIAEGADVAGVISGDLPDRIAAVTDARLVFVSSDLKVRERPIEDMGGE